MSDDYQLRKDIDKSKTFIDNLEYVLSTKANSNDIKDFFSLYYDKSETYSKSEINRIGGGWQEIEREEGVTLYVNPFIRLCELCIDIEDFTGLSDNFNFQFTKLVPSDYAPLKHVVSPNHREVGVVVYIEPSHRRIYVRNLKGETISSFNIKTNLMWHY